MLEPNIISIGSAEDVLPSPAEEAQTAAGADDLPCAFLSLSGLVRSPSRTGAGNKGLSEL